MTTPSERQEVASSLRVGIVGPCGAGKTTLAAGLRQEGYDARVIAQEHSYVPDMWQRLAKPEVLIFLQASWAVTSARRRLNWTEAEWLEQQHRLRHARQHAHFYLETDTLTIEEVRQRVLDFLAPLGGATCQSSGEAKNAPEAALKEIIKPSAST